MVLATTPTDLPKGWAVKPLGELVTFLDGMRRPVKDSDRAKMKGSIPYYGASGIVDYVNDYIFDEDLVLLGEDGENILSRNVRLAFRVTGKCWVNNHAHVLRPKPEVNTVFLAEKLESLNYQRFNSGTAQPKLNKQTCSTIPVALPLDRKEQDAIATALSDVDALVESLEKLIAKKRLIKQGAMKSLLSGKSRLSGFSKPWNEDTLSNIAHYRRGSFPQPYGLAKWYDDIGGFPFVQVVDVDDNGKIKEETKRRISKAARDLSVFVPKGTVILTIQGSIGRIAIIHYDTCVDRTLLIFESFKIPFDKYFFKYAVFLLFEKEKQNAPGGIIKTITKEALSKFVLKFPDVEEQSSIATFLKELDEDLQLQEKRLTKVRGIKQGMMQELLTGRIRLV